MLLVQNNYVQIFERREDIVKRVLFLSLIMLMLTCTSLFAAASSCTVASPVGDQVQTITWVCTASSSDGSYPSASTSIASAPVKGWVFALEMIPGGTAPTSGTTVALKKGNSMTIVSGTTSTVPTNSTAASSGWASGETLWPLVTGNSVNSAVLTIKAYIWQQKQP